MATAVAAVAVFRRRSVTQRQGDATRYRKEAASRTASAERMEAEAAELAAAGLDQVIFSMRGPYPANEVEPLGEALRKL